MQRTGMRLALGVGVLFVAIVGGYIVWGSRGTKGPVPGDMQAPKVRPGALSGAATDGPQLGSASTVDIDLMDKKNPGRQAGELIFASMEPLEGGRYDVVKPQAWLFLVDGRTVHIRAQSGKLYMPVYGKEPESGTIKGDVVIDFYPPKAGAARIDPAIDKPIGSLKTDSITFDATLGQLTTPDAFALTSEQADLFGTGIQALFNEPKQRLEYFKIERGDRLIVRKTPNRTEQEKPGPTLPTSPPTAAAPAPANPPAPRPERPHIETLYRMAFNDSVRATQGTRTLAADTLHVWARMVDGKLPANAVAEIKFAGPEESAAKAANAVRPESRAPAQAGTSATTQAPVSPQSTGAPLTLYWAGPCEIVPLESSPPELAKDHVAGRFTAEKTGAVKLTDSERNAGGEAVAIEYGATTGRLSLIGAEDHRMFLDVPSAGRIESTRLTADLVHGIVHIPSGGALTRQGAEEFRLSWGEQADFTFLQRDGTLVNAISQAILSGGVLASDRSGSISGKFARADFVPTALTPNSLSRLILEESATAESKKSGTMSADKIDVAFVPGTKDADPVPRQLTATGHASAESKGDILKADSIEAVLAKNEKGGIDVATAHASGAVSFVSERERVQANANEMRADLGWTGLSGADLKAGRRQIVELMGEGARVVHTGKSEEISTIRGDQIRLNGVAQAIEVFGPGSFDHNNPGKAVVTASWTSGMSFDNSSGKLECAGDAVAVSSPDRMTQDKIEAGRIKLTLAPGTGMTVKPGGEGAPSKSTEPNVLKAEAYGSVVERDGGFNARITSERFVQDAAAPDGRRRETLQYLEGPTIIADNAAGTLDVPAAGKLVLVDKRGSSKVVSSGEALGTGPGEARGDTLFEWDGTLHAERKKGEMDMLRNVRLIHRGADDGQVTTLQCDHLTATARGSAASDESALGGKTSLTSAVASGAVFATFGPANLPGQSRPVRKELTADRVSYDTIKGTIDASAAEGGNVTFFDPARGSPVNAGGLIWNLASDRIDITRPGTFVVPR